MPEDSTVDNMEGATTSNDANTSASQDASGNSSNPDVDNAAIKGDTGEGAAPTLKDAIAASLGKASEESEGEPPASPEDQEKKDAEKAAADTARLDKNPRFQEVIAERDHARNELKQFEPIREFLKNSILSEQDSVATLQIGNSVNRALSGEEDPVSVLNQLAPIVQALQAAAGLLLPPDIQQAVNDGQISKKYAEDLAKQRAANAGLVNKTEREKQALQAFQQQQVEQQIHAIKMDVSKAVTDWETKQRKIDPDYEPKRELIYNQVTAALLARRNEGKVTTAKDAIDISEAAYQKVSDVLQNAYPKRQAVGKNISGGAPSSKIIVKPTDFASAIEAAVNKRS